jgi:acyl carrier protein
MIKYEEYLEFLSQRYSISKEKLQEVDSFAELGIDSLSLFSLLQDVESKFDLRIDTEDLTEIDSVSKMYSLIEKFVENGEN